MNSKSKNPTLSAIDLTDADSRFALARRLVDGAEQHAANAGDPAYAQGDLEIIIERLLGAMPPAEAREALTSLVVADGNEPGALADMPEYEFLAH